MHCGHKVAMQESIAQKVKIDQSHTFSNWIQLGLKALSAFNYQSAESYGEKILEQDINNGMGWYLKACGAINNQERKVEAYDCFMSAAEHMSVDEKRTHKLNFFIEMLSFLETELGSHETCENLNFNDEVLLDDIHKENEIAEVFFEELKTDDEIELMSELFEATHNSKWTYCWKILSFIQVYGIDSALLLTWSDYGKTMIELLINVDNTLKRRSKELPSLRVLNVCPDALLEVRKKSFDFVSNNRERVSKANDILDMLDLESADSSRHIELTEFFANNVEFEKLWEGSLSDLKTSCNKIIGKTTIRTNAIGKLFEVWEIFIDKLITLS